MNNDFRLCPSCGNKRVGEHFLPTGNTSLYGNNNTSYICIECIASKINRKDLGTINKMCQFLDLPFDPNKWIEMEKKYEKLGPLLIDYCQEMTNGEYANNDWYIANQTWEKCREYGTMVEELTAIHSDLLMYLRKKWGHIGGFTLDEYLRMEEYEKHTLSHYPFKDEARRDMVRKLAKLSALADYAISTGDNKEATTILTSYNTLMKELGIRTETTKDENTIETLSELVGYLEKTGFLLNYKITENRDIVDKTIANMQQYVRRLFTDSNETVNEIYNSKMVASEGGTEITDEDIENIYATMDEENGDFGVDMDDGELEQLFKEVENEYQNH